MKYIALIRGINVGGKNKISMKHLQSVISATGFTNVTTYIQSGNLLFESKDTNMMSIAKKLEGIILGEFGCDARVVVLSATRFRKIAQKAPENWKTSNDIRKYVAFVMSSISIPEVMVNVVPRVGVDELAAGEGVVYMSTLLNSITKSGFSRLASLKVYKHLTIRNYNTVCKLAELANGS